MTAPAGEPGTARQPVVVIGVGNEYRRDDGVGPQVLARLGASHLPEGVRLVLSDGEPAAMIEAWSGARLAVVIDAIRPGSAEPGRTHRLEIEEVSAARPAAVSSHGLGVGDAIGLGRVLGRMPARLIVHAVEVADCGQGTGMTAAVSAAAERLTNAVLADIMAAISGGSA